MSDANGQALAYVYFRKDENEARQARVLMRLGGSRPTSPSCLSCQAGVAPNRCSEPLSLLTPRQSLAATVRRSLNTHFPRLARVPLFGRTPRTHGPGFAATRPGPALPPPPGADFECIGARPRQGSLPQQNRTFSPLAAFSTSESPFPASPGVARCVPGGSSSVCSDCSPPRVCALTRHAHAFASSSLSCRLHPAVRPDRRPRSAVRSRLAARDQARRLSPHGAPGRP